MLSISGRSAHEDDRGLALAVCRKIDVAMAGIGLLVLTPIMLVTAVLIRLLAGEPLILPKDMIGFGGRVFVTYKFRTKVGNASANLWAEYLVEALRRSSLDKLPQLFNVIRGDMCLVGPRPRSANEFLLYFTQAPECLLARPGLDRHVASLRPEPRPRQSTEVALDRHYVRHWSMRLDFALLNNAISVSHHEDRTA